MLISENYVKQNRKLHKSVPLYGARDKSLRYESIAELRRPGETILDYGCGKGLMAKALKGVTNYDPATFPGSPDPHDIVVCMDVLEHVEPACLNDVLLHIAGLSKRMAYLVICNKQGSKKLPDGRFAHLIVHGADWWGEELAKRFTQVSFIEDKADGPYDMTFICNA